MNYKYASIKQKAKEDNSAALPEDINLIYENLAKNKYKSQLLYDCLVDIRKKKKWTNKNVGTIITNRQTGDMLCVIYANGGVIKDIDFRKVVLHKSAMETMNSAEKIAYSTMWNDKYLKLNESNLLRNPSVSFKIPKTLNGEE